MKIHIVGWSGINHSYSIVAEEYVKGLMKNPNNEFYFTPYKFYNNDWKKCRTTIFDSMPHLDEFDNNNLKNFIDVTIKFTYPYNLIPDVHSKCTIVFMTCEFNYLTDFVDTTDICDNVWILTPSDYSKSSLIATGFKENKIIVVPHCYDYIDSPLTVKQLREKYGFPFNDYIYYHNSSLTSNKNISSILECFERVYRGNKNVTLFIKGLDNTYGSRNKLIETMQNIKSNIGLTCESKIKYIGNDVSSKDLVEFYKLSDCYVSPFLAEGFNLPVLEAMCHGKHVICTKGGPPDEFAKDACFIESTIINTGDKINVNGNMKDKKCLSPSKSQLFEKMMLAPLITHLYDKEKYRRKYSCTTIGKILYDKMNYILTENYIIPEIILLPDIHNVFNFSELSMIIKNIRMFCDNVHIYVGIDENNKIEQLNEKNITYVPLEIPAEKTNIDTINVIKKIMKQFNISNAVYVSNNIIVMMDPRVILSQNKMETNNKIIYSNEKDEILIAYVNVINNTNNTNDNNEYIKEDILTTADVKEVNKKYKWCIKKNNQRILYVEMQNDSINSVFKKVKFIKNTTNEDPSVLLIQPEDNTMTPSKFLHQVDIAIITKNTYEKYKQIFRSAPLTILFDEKNTFVEKSAYNDLQKKNIFVYPESLEYFFRVIYNHINNKFKLYTFSCDFTNNKKYELFDIKNNIIECVEIKYI